MPPLDSDDLPPPLAAVMRPWVGVLASATLGMGEDVTVGATVACTGLERRIVMTPGVERAIADARGACEALALELNRKNGVLSPARAAAQVALETLVGQLRTAQPNARAIGLGLGW